MEFLDLDYNKHISDDGLQHLADLSSLGHLSLDSAQIRGAGLVHLAPLKRLEFLVLSGTQITDDGLRHLQGVTNLHTLHLARNPGITDAGLFTLNPLKTCANMFTAMQFPTKG